MADYENLLDSIDAVIKANNRREITGQILQNTLHQMVGSLGENYQLAGFATPTTNPNNPDQNVFYVTDEAGVYTNFGGITLGNGLSFLMWKNEQWTSKTLGIVTAQWVDNNYVSKAFLRNMFRFYDEDGVEIFANDTESVVDNIRAMVGLWTNHYLSALGIGDDYSPVILNEPLSSINNAQLGLPQSANVTLVWNGTNWVYGVTSSGVDMSVVWSAMAAATSEQINASHLSTALSSYVTNSSLSTTLSNYVTSTALNTTLASYATQSWVGNNYVSTSFFNAIFQLEDANGNAITPNNTTTAKDRLKILVGAYTDQYLSALGLNSNTPASSSTLADLLDVNITSPVDGQGLIYDATTQKWVNGSVAGSYTLPIATSSVLGGIKVGTTLQINSTTGVLDIASGYATQSWVNTQLSGYLPLSGGTLSSSTNTPLILNSTSTYCYMYFKKSNTNKASIGYFENFAFIANEAGTYARIGVKDDGTPQYWRDDNKNNAHTLLHDGNVKTINGQSIYGSGDISVGGGASGNYLPLTGGTLINAGNVLTIKSTNSNSYILFYINTNTSKASCGYYNGISFVANEAGTYARIGVIDDGTPQYWTSGGSSASKYTLLHAGNYSSYALPLSGGYIRTSDSMALKMKRTTSGGGIFEGFMPNNQETKWWHVGATSEYKYQIQLINNSVETPYFVITDGGNVGIGTTSPSYKLHVAGDIYATGGVTALSDIRKKDVFENDINLSVEQIANAPLIKFLWKDRHEDGEQVGTIAQYWQTALPQVVKDKANELSMQYGVTSLVSIVKVARKVVNHEQRIKELEKECERLRTELEQYKAA